MRAALLVLLVSACGRVGFEQGSDGGRAVDATPPRDSPADATPPDSPVDAAPDAPPPDAAVPLGDFDPPALVAELSDPAVDDDPTVTADLREIFFASERTGGLGGADIWTSRRTSPMDGWAAPTPVVEVSSASFDETPGVSADGLTLYFGSNRAGGVGGYDTWVATRPDRDPTTVWSTPIVATDLSSPMDDLQAQPAASDLHLVMHRTMAGQRELYQTVRADVIAPWNPPTPIMELNTAAGERSPCLASEGLEIWFSSDRASGMLNVHDLFIAVRPTVDGSFAPPTLAPVLNSSADDDDAWVSPDGHVIFFSSARTGNLEIYEAHR